jgi:V/A-type H+-transporting ATPase subunit D
MARLNVNPNRMELLKLRRRLAVARRGHKLLKDKLDELMKRFLELMRDASTMRERLEEELSQAYAAFAMARSEVMKEELQEAMAIPCVEIFVEADEKNIMGVKAPEFRVDMAGGAGCYGLMTAPFALDGALRRFQGLVPGMVELAETENRLKRLAMEIEKTRRRVNALEYVLIPSLEETVTYITMKLDEMERSYRTQLMKIKSMQEATQAGS